MSGNDGKQARLSGIRNSGYFRQCLYGIVCVVICLFALENAQAEATNRYVATNVPLSAWPYDSWTTAATNLKDAVDAANANNSGDNVIVSNGTYYVTTAIIVSNTVVTNVTGDWTKVIVNGNYNTVTSRCFILRNANAMLSGLTITNGRATTNQFPELIGSGGGIWASNGIVRNCLITGCRADVFASDCGGGGIYGSYNTTVDNCSLIRNVVNQLAGGSSSLYITGGGGGAFLNACCITNCVVAWNSVTKVTGNGISGGGVCAIGDVRIANCTIVSNNAATYGGGVFMRPWTLVGEIKNSIISSNAAAAGGGITVWGSAGVGPLFIRNCLIANNANWGIFWNNMQPPRPVEACTIVSNSAGGICYNSNCTGTKTNVADCIIYYNAGGTNVYDNTTGGVLKTSVWYSCVAPGSGFTIAGEVTNEPSFVDMANGNYRLRADSPCINRGTNLSWMLNGVDLDGNRRIFRENVDLGSYELILYNGTVISFR